MNSNRDVRGKFVKGNVISRKRSSLAKTGGFLSTREKKGIERELEIMKKELADQVGDSEPEGRDRILISQVINSERILRYAGMYIIKFGIEDLVVADLQLKSMDSQRHALSDLKAEIGEKRHLTPLEKAKKFSEEKARRAKEDENDLEEGSHGIL